MPKSGPLKKVFRATREQIAAAVNLSAGCEYLISPRKTFLCASGACRNLTGYSALEFLRSPGLLSRIIHPQDRPLYQQHLDKQFNQKQASGFELRIITRGGQLRLVKFDSHYVIDEKGKWLGRRMVAVDTTGQREAEDKMAFLQNQFNMVLKATHASFYVVDAGFNINYVDDYLKGVYGACRGKKCFAYFFRSARPCRICGVVKAAKTKTSTVYETPFKAGKGSRRVVVIPYQTAESKRLFLKLNVDISDFKKIEEIIQQAARHQEELVNSINGVVWEGDVRSFSTLFVSTQVERLLGFPVSRWLLSKDFWLERIHPDDHKRVLNSFRDAVKSRRPLVLEYRMITKRDKTIWVRNLLSIVSRKGRAFKMRSLIIDVTSVKKAEEERQKMLEDLNEKKEKLIISERNLQKFSRNIIQVREEEKKKLATELHDQVGVMAVSLDSALTIAEQEVKENKYVQAASKIVKIKSLLKGSIKNLKEIATDLRPPNLDIIGLPGALRLYFSEVTKNTRIKIDFQISTLNNKIDDTVAITLYRIAQEALTNIIKHAGATSVKVGLSVFDGSINLVIQDNGKGFDVSKTTVVPRGMGLQGMKERLESIGGSLIILSLIGRGTTIEADAPTQPLKKDYRYEY